MAEGGRRWETRTGEGSLFANSRKQAEKDADIVGETRIRCPHCQRDSLWYLNGWRREKKQRKPDGTPVGYWYALKTKLKDRLAGAQPGGVMPGAQAAAMPGASPTNSNTSAPSGAPSGRSPTLPSNVVAMPTGRPAGGPPR